MIRYPEKFLIDRKYFSLINCNFSLQLGVVAAFAFLMVQDVSADGKTHSMILLVRLRQRSKCKKIFIFLFSVCTDNMIYMDLCVQWKDMCAQSKFLQDKCPRTCGTCAPGTFTTFFSVFNELYFHLTKCTETKLLIIFTNTHPLKIYSTKNNHSIFAQ